MRSRGLVVAIAIVLAVAAAAAVILYTQGVKEDAVRGGDLTPVIVSTQEIPANQQLDPLIDQGIFSEIQVPGDALVGGAVKDVEELRGVTTTTPILANEQISTSRLSSAETPLNLTGVSEGHLGVAIELDAPQGGIGNIQPGDQVQVFATYQGVKVIKGDIREIDQQRRRDGAPPGRSAGLHADVDPDRSSPPHPEPSGGHRDGEERQLTDPGHLGPVAAGRPEPRLRAGEGSGLARSAAPR